MCVASVKTSFLRELRLKNATILTLGERTPMGIKEQLKEDIKVALKAGEKAKISVIRMLLSEIQYAGTAGDAAKELSDAECLKAIQGYHKKLSKSLADFSDVEKKRVIQSEINIIESYLPKRASESEVMTAVDKVLSDQSDRNFGTLMKLVTAKLGDQADGALISKVLKSRLN